MQPGASCLYKIHGVCGAVNLLADLRPRIPVSVLVFRNVFTTLSLVLGPGEQKDIVV